ncbi:MAG: hypothetical protein P8I82_01940 [Flavobacteriales bacterium]|jgi:hypothetical protein|nr:hypothetical protein [Flavobacteriales bacterium]
MILTKRLIIVFILSLSLGCGFKELHDLNIYNSSKNKIENPYFSNKKIDYNYTVKIEKNKKKINGIISIKKTDSIYHRIVFMSGFGYKLFDIEVSRNDFKWKSINAEIDKKYFKKLLRDNITNLIYGNNKIKFAYKKNNRLIYKSKEERKEILYLLDTTNTLIEIYNINKGFKKRFISFNKIQNNIATNIKIQNFNPSITIHLEFLNN